ncbi:phage portal protein [Bordetella bronchiseptica]|uniref:phage portal protein n=1 Tax=Bordetella bronchiseptica TaxID=518 RepID=UPI000F6E4395|nr:phage portal protein [Bordetella bronchiseptica]VEI25163.1 phage portal protein [Bordetella bronchiseptica]
MGLFFNRDLSSGRVPGSQAGWTPSFLGSRATSSGQMVTDQTAFALPMVQSCTTLITESLAQLPIELYRRVGSDGGREAAQDHPLYRILKYTPNPWQTPFERMEGAQNSAGLRGNAFSYIDRNARGEIQGLYPLSADKVTVLKGGDLRPFYRIGSSERLLSPENIHHVRWASFDNYVGLSPIMVHANDIGHSQALRDYAAKSFRHGTALSGVLERPKDAPAITNQATVDKITSDWSERYSRAMNPAAVALLQEGMTFKPLTLSNVDIELIAALNLSAAEIARIYKVPLPMVGSMEGATYNNVENLQIQFVVYCLMPWIRRHEQAMQRDLLGVTERPEFFIEFNVGGLLRGNITARYAAYAVGRQWGWLSINDIRRLENLPPVPGGDIYLQPLNMIDATKPLPMPGSADPKAVDEIAKVLS